MTKCKVWPNAAYEKVQNVTPCRVWPMHNVIFIYRNIYNIFITLESIIVCLIFSPTVLLRDCGGGGLGYTVTSVKQHYLSQLPSSLELVFTLDLSKLGIVGLNLVFSWSIHYSWFKKTSSILILYPQVFQPCIVQWCFGNRYVKDVSNLMDVFQYRKCV